MCILCFWLKKYYIVRSGFIVSCSTTMCVYSTEITILMTKNDVSYLQDFDILQAALSGSRLYITGSFILCL